MALILRVQCGSCHAEASYSDMVLLAVLRDGTEHVLRHPCEDLDAEALGTSLGALRRDGRLRRATPVLCAVCGTVSYHSARGQRITCADCGANSCIPVARVAKLDGCGVAVLAVCVSAFLRMWSLTAAGVGLVAWLVGIHVLRTRRYRADIARLPCWSCGTQALTEEVYGKS